MDVFHETNALTVIAAENNEIDNLYKNVKFIHFYQNRVFKIFIQKVYNKIKKMFLFRKGVKKHLNENKYDIIWVASAEAAVQLMGIINKEKYILNIYELYARIPWYYFFWFRKTLKSIAQSAHSVIVPEVNRANILRVWFNLKKTPYVIPNKPINHPLKRKLPIEEKYMEIMNHDKIILYQGILATQRNLDVICESASQLADFRFVLMGRKTVYAEYLLKKYSNVYHIDFITPPKHLHITSHCYIGIVTYDYVSLNTIYCAPNKIWEYAGFSIPMLANGVPGLVNTVGKYDAGCCIDTDDIGAIIKAIRQIDESYSGFQDGAKKLFESVDVRTSLNEIVSDAR
jgi:glycosyltransferase involved in cell wall biosynthesis